MSSVSNLVKIGTIFTGGKKREYENPVLKRGVFSLGVLIGLYHIYTLGIWRTYTTELHSFVHLSCFLVLVFLNYSYSEKSSRGVPIIDAIFVLLVLVVVAYFAVNFDRRLMFYSSGVYSPLSALEFLSGLLLLFLIFEGTRRLVGLPFVIVIMCFMLLMGIGSYLPGKWAFPSFSLREIIDAIVWSPLEGIWGISLRVSATYIVLFFIFGKLMQHAGIGNLLISLAWALAGGTRGGPAKVAVLGSGLIGSVTGGPATNIVMTGTFTIPMMKQIGYKSHYAGGVECAASTGSSIVPPVMTGVAFIMAALTEEPYAQVIKVAFLPAFLYYLGIFLQVHFQAIKMGIEGKGKKASIGQISGLLKEQGHMLFPIVFLVGLLLKGYTPEIAAFWAIVAVVFTAALRKKTRMTLGQILTALSEAIREAILIALTLSLAGIILISLFSTGLSGMISHSINVASGGSLLVVALIAAFSSLILGMTGPVIGSYLITVVVIAPAMVKSGLPTIAAHFYALYFANVAFITPPVAIGAFIAAGIAGASFWRIGFTAVRLAMAAFVVPVIFLYRPGLLLIGSASEIILALVLGLAIIACIASALEGWMLVKLNGFQRILLLLGGIGLISTYMLVMMVSSIFIVLVLIWQLIDKRRALAANLIGRK